MNFNKWAAKILLLAVGILLCQSSDATTNDHLAIRGVWCLHFVPPYMVPGFKRLTESYFHLMLSSTTNDEFSGQALWNFGVLPDDRANRVLASVTGRLSPDKNVFIELFAPANKGLDQGRLILLTGKFDGPDIKGSVDNGTSSNVIWSPLKESLKLPSSGNFVLSRINSAAEKDIEALFNKLK